MKTHVLTLAILATALFTAACTQPSMPYGTASFNSPLGMQTSADNKRIIFENRTYTLTQAKSFPLIDSWIYSKRGQTPLVWTKRIELQRYKKVNADEIFSQMKDAVKSQLNEYDDKSRTICFVTERKDGQLKEVNIWKYADAEGSTYANGIMWQYPAGATFNTFMKGEFGRTCMAMRIHTLITPPAL